MSEYDLTRRALLPRSTARALVIAGAAVSLWIVGQATASAEEPLPMPQPASVDEALAGPGNELLSPVVTTVGTVSAPVAVATEPVVDSATDPVAAVTSQVTQIAAVRAAVPVLESVAAVPEQVSPALGGVVEPAAEAVIERVTQPAAEPLARDVPPPAAAPTGTVPAPLPAAGAATPAQLSDVPVSEAQGATTQVSSPVASARPIPLSTPARQADAAQSAPSAPGPTLPHPSTVPVAPTPVPATCGYGTSHLLDQPSADLAAAVLAASAALSAAADDARDSAAAAPFEPSCSPD